MVKQNKREGESHLLIRRPELLVVTELVLVSDFSLASLRLPVSGRKFKKGQHSTLDKFSAFNCTKQRQQEIVSGKSVALTSRFRRESEKNRDFNNTYLF